MLAALQERTVHTGSDYRRQLALLEAIGGGGPHSREAKKQAQRETREHLARGEKREVGLEEAACMELHSTPDGAGVGAVEEEVGQRLRDDCTSGAVAEEAVGVSRAAAATHIVGVVEHPEEGVTHGGGDKVTVEKVGKAGGDIRDVTGATHSQTVNEGVPERRERRGLVTRRAGGESARELVD